jgi:hypothetical protein
MFVAMLAWLVLAPAAHAAPPIPTFPAAGPTVPPASAIADPRP